MDFVPLALPGCFEIRPKAFRDARGSFAKPFVASRFAAHGLPTVFAEEYYSSSQRGVVRGMHFQTPPHEHGKLVYCVRGEVLDVIVDLRRGSPTYGHHHQIRLDESHPVAVYMPAGLAHGFCALSDDATLIYKVTSEHAPAHDCGVRWDSVGVVWPVDAPIVSDRDRAFPALGDFVSPFAFDGEASR